MAGLRNSVHPAWLLLSVMAPAMAAAPSSSRDWQAEAGGGLSYYDNFFNTGDSAPSQDSAWVTSVYATGERAFKGGARRWDLSGGVEAFFNLDISDADTQVVWGAAETRFGASRAGIELGYQPNRLYSEDSDGIYLDETRVSVYGRHDFSSTLSTTLEYRRKRHSFDQPETQRNADIDEFNGNVRFVLSEQVVLRAFALWSQKDARDDARSWNTTGYGLAVELSPAPQWSVFARARWRDREYEDALPGDSNFGRDDDLFEALVDARWTIGKDWGLRGQIEYRDAESTRQDRNYDAMAVTAGAFKRF